MKRKQDVDYSRGMGETRCKNCKFFVRPSMTCLKVWGAIDPEFWCKLFKWRN